MRDTAIKKYNLEQEAAKKTRKELQHQARLLKEKERQEKRVARQEAKERREKEKAEERAATDARNAERERQKEARDSQQSIQSPSKGKRKASRPLHSLAERVMSQSITRLFRSATCFETACPLTTLSDSNCLLSEV